MKEFFRKVGRYLSSITALSEYIDAEAASENIRRDVRFRGPNVYILFFAIMIASLGLNVNSIPVIIGAMLISPLMGPIIGFGLAIGTNDVDLLKSALKNLFVMVLISILGATIYFWLSPLDMEHPTELLARTNPTIYDVLIALFGGFAGIIEISRKDKGTVLSGVAIATALMPPLCTVGYGIANLNWHYAVGALYLFFINSTFIALATFLAVKYLRYPVVREADPKRARHRRHLIWMMIIIIIIPSVVSAITVIYDNNMSRNATRLVEENKILGKSYIYDYKVQTSNKPITVDLYMAGERLDDVSREHLLTSAETLGFTRQQIIFHEEAVLTSAPLNQEQLVKDLFQQNEQQLRQKDMLIDSLRQVIDDDRKMQVPVATLTEEIVAQYPKVQSVSISRGELYDAKQRQLVEGQIVVLIECPKSETLSKDELSRLKTWLTVRLQTQEINIIVR